jgi:chloramphenicol-sensitive protein RarD
MNQGLLYAASAYLIWGLLPIFWKALQTVPALEILAHRIVWSLVVVLLLLAYKRAWRWLPAALRDRRTLLTFLATASFLSLNWFAYIWAVNAGYILETSLGYFITPLVNILLGMIFLQERLRFWQGVALALASSAVLYLTLSYGAFPWIALTLALSFGAYGLLRKIAPLNSLEGLTLETLLMFFPALAYLLTLAVNGRGSFGTTDARTTLLLILTGIITAFPLLLFASGARRITMTSLGFLQYIAPTITFFLGVFVYHEPLSTARLVGFSLIWVALLIYTLDSSNAAGLLSWRPQPNKPAP